MCIIEYASMHIFKGTHLHEYVHVIYHTCTEILVPSLVRRSDSQVVLEMNFALMEFHILKAGHQTSLECMKCMEN